MSRPIHWNEAPPKISMGNLSGRQLKAQQGRSCAATSCPSMGFSIFHGFFGTRMG